MKKRLIFIVLFVALFAAGFASKPYKVVFYNLENFFDTINDPGVRDSEFTPEGDKKWTSIRYAKKLKNIERIFSDIVEQDDIYPVVIGVCEVENRSVMEDIVATEKLAPANYSVVHYDSPDARGIDVAFMYRPDQFKLEGSAPIRAIIPGKPDFKTRDILTMWGTIDDEPLFFMVAHWSSRGGGQSKSEYLRIANGSQMRSIADSVSKATPGVKIVAMGDFNDDPADKSVYEAFGAKGKIRDAKDGDLFNPFHEMHRAGLGTLAYRGAWNLFDVITVSESLVRGDGLQLEKGDSSKFYGNILKEPYMLQGGEGYYKGYPFRTYVGDDFKGGFSDHFPVYIYLDR